MSGAPFDEAQRSSPDAAITPKRVVPTNPREAIIAAKIALDHSRSGFRRGAEDAVWAQGDGRSGFGSRLALDLDQAHGWPRGRLCNRFCAPVNFLLDAYVPAGSSS
jgi:hypothetical protein